MKDYKFFIWWICDIYQYLTWCHTIHHNYDLFISTLLNQLAHDFANLFPLLIMINNVNLKFKQSPVCSSMLNSCHLSRPTLSCHLFINLRKFNFCNCKISKTIPSIKGILTNLCVSELYWHRKRMSKRKYRRKEHTLVLLSFDCSLNNDALN